MSVTCFYMIRENVNSPTADTLTGSSGQVTEVIKKENSSTIMFAGILSGVLVLYQRVNISHQLIQGIIG